MAPAHSDRPSARTGRKSRPGRRSRLTFGRKAIGTTAAIGLVFTAAVVSAATSSAETPKTRAQYAPSGTNAWYNDASLGKTDSTDQYAQSNVKGLTDNKHHAAFLMRYASKTSRVMVAISGSTWRIDGSLGEHVWGQYPHSTSSGLFRVELSGKTVKLYWNGTLVTKHSLTNTYSGHAVVPSVWQATTGVVMNDLEASSLGSTGGGNTPPPPTEPGGGSGTWYSGASGDAMANGSFNSWRKTAASVAGTWADTGPDVQQELWAICGGEYTKWNKPLDLAIGAIFKSSGESWSKAAGGAYTSRWRKVLTTMKKCWGSRDPGKLFVRWAHEYNLPNDWGVQHGQEADFIKATKIFSNLRYEIFPGINIVLCPNDGTDGDLATDVRKTWPGKDSQGRKVIDVYGVDAYNSWPHITSQAEYAKHLDSYDWRGQPLGIEVHRKLAEGWGVPFVIGEWANAGDPSDGGGGGESPAFIKGFYAWAKAHSGDPAHPKAGQLVYEVLFNGWRQFELYPSTIQPQTAKTYAGMSWGKG
jgi:hypothetical protein